MNRVAAKPPDPWFHRKSEKLVLAVLMVHVDGEPRFVSGINAEVSLPAGRHLLVWTACVPNQPRSRQSNSV